MPTVAHVALIGFEDLRVAHVASLHYSSRVGHIARHGMNAAYIFLMQR